MRKHNSRIAIRLPSEEKLQVEQLIQDGMFPNLSQIVRRALKEFLEK